MHKTKSLVLLMAAVVAVALGGCGSSTSKSALPVVASTSSTTAVTAAEPGSCDTTDLTISAVDSAYASDHDTITFALQNSHTQPCTLMGYPGVSVYNKTTKLTDDTGHTIGGASVGLVTVSPGARAYFDATYSVKALDSEVCPAATEVRVTPPNSTKQLVLPLTNVAISRICVLGGLTLSPVRSDQ